ncbi:MAG: menA [Parachlamydiales bacterium]|nr:menA [Parachlamydiales bacterium]
MHSLKNDLLISPRFRSAVRSWIQSARPKTLIAGISPVLIGTSIASMYQPISCWVLIFCLGFSISLQLAANWANDYFDVIKGVDTSARKGPIRPIHLQSLPPAAMLRAAIIALILAAGFSLPLLARAGLNYWPMTALCMLCAILYTGGPRPLGYLGLGDVLVFAFYGPIATAGSALAQLHTIPSDAWIASIIPGSLSCAILCVNNIRDIDEDRRAKKLTLPARFGKRFGQIEYAVCLLAALITPLFLPKSLLAVWLIVPFAIEPLAIVFNKEAHLKNSLLKEGDSSTANGGRLKAPDKINSSAYLPLKGQDCASSKLFNRALALTALFLLLYTLLFCMISYAYLHF